MKKVYSSDELKKYIKQGEKQFLAGNKKMKVAFNVYKALGHKERQYIQEGSLYDQQANLKATLQIADPTLIALAIIFCTTIVAVVLILSGRKGTVKPSPEGPILTVE